MISFERLRVENVPWEKIGTFGDVSIFQTRLWIEFLADYFCLEPVVATVKSNGRIVGYFTGLITKKFGFRILGSPFRGWNTYYMGFILEPFVSYQEVLRAFPDFAFKELKCHFLMIVDTNIKESDLAKLPYHVRGFNHYKLDLTKSEEELSSNFENKYVRRAIRRAEKKGVVIEESTDPGFADEYFAQYQEVMRRQKLRPIYGLDFVRKMIECLLPTGNLLLLRAKNGEGKCIATLIDFVFNKTAIGWGGG